MTTKLIPLTALLLMLSSPTFAAPATEPTGKVQGIQPSDRTAPAPQPPQQLAWQRVGAPISQET
jgi:hypothetical protein